MGHLNRRKLEDEPEKISSKKVLRVLFFFSRFGLGGSGLIENKNGEKDLRDGINQRFVNGSRNGGLFGEQIFLFFISF